MKRFLAVILIVCALPAGAAIRTVDRVVAVVNLVLGFLSPPVGLCFFVAAAVTGAKPGKMFIVTLPFFFAACGLLILLSIFPVLSTYLVR